MGTRIPSDHADLRGQLILMLVLAVAIGLRSMSIGSGDTPRSPYDIPTANEVQHDGTHQGCPSSQEKRSTNSESERGVDDFRRVSRIEQEVQK